MASPAVATPLATSATAVAAGGDHACALTAAGGVECWGANNFGQLGDGTTTPSNVPVVSGLTSGVTSITAYASGGCALTNAGGVECWGQDNVGQLGNGSFSGGATSSPVPVSGLTSGVVALAGGTNSTCALTSAGGVECWGYNNAGQLGNGTTTNSDVPVQVTGLTSGVTSVVVGGDHACALTSSGGDECWGAGFAGQLGNGSTAQSSIPVQVSGLSSEVAAIGAGSQHSCALTSAGAVECWGNNENGQLGNGTFSASDLPVQVIGLTSGAKLLSGDDEGDHSCAVSSTGTLECWGFGGLGEIGDGTYSTTALPEPVIGLGNGVVASTSSGIDFVCAVTNIDSVECWGAGGAGNLGNGASNNTDEPVQVVGLIGDSTDPAISASHTADGKNGWNVSSPVTETVTASDADSGLAASPACTVDSQSVSLTSAGSGTWTFSVSGDGLHAVRCSVSDKVGGHSTATDTVQIDTTAPGITVSTPADGASYLIGSSHAASYGCSDAGSGLASCVGDVANGSNVDTSSVGSHSFTVDAADAAGNTSSSTVHYSVGYQFSGFLAPVNNPPQVNAGKSGRTYPVKFQLTDGNGNYISALSAVQSVSYKSDNCAAFSSDSSDALETTATGGTSLRYDSTANQYVYNWASPRAGCYTLFVTLDSGQVYPAYFHLS